MRRALVLAIGLLLALAEVPAPAAEAPAPGGAAAAGTPATDRPSPGEIRPTIVWDAIPFGAKRKRQTAAYSKRHYGERSYRLSDPQVVVIHFTDGTSYGSAWNHFAANGVHLGEKPGVCAHFIIDTDGTIHQLVHLGLRCRHAIGMNWTAFGIEHVGTSAEDILDNRAMMRASLRLTVWLMLRYAVAHGNVIGHAEILRSPYHRELYDDWRCSTHADWNRTEMRVYRRRLVRLAERLGVPTGARPHWVPSGC